MRKMKENACNNKKKKNPGFLLSAVSVIVERQLQPVA